MPLVKYIGNVNPNEGTNAIKVGHERVLRLGINQIDLTDEEIARLRGKYELEIEEPEAEAALSVPVESVTNTTPVTVGSTPSVLSTPPTPSVGN